MDRYLREEINIDGDDESKQMILQASISSIKRNTREIEPDSDFTAEDICLQSVIYIEKILKTQRVPIIVEGSNSNIEKLVEDPVFMFKYKYDSCFIWIDVEQLVLNRRVDMRVDQIVKAANVKTLKELWDSLENKYKTEDAAMKKFIVAKFLDYKMIDRLIVNDVFQVAAIIE
ncbi:adenylate isopentenyltransferase 3, chloroplastic-like [Solanum lycopersicum]|uniref:adenylate isopentenyltransferase 3, chloroplastic-like n=1 Tax=Solanum lycopersicum TaxID=4081 RepID=UPI0037486E38